MEEYDIFLIVFGSVMAAAATVLIVVMSIRNVRHRFF
jgi:hypothetical protein